MGLLLSAVQRVRGAAQRISCASNLRQLAIAVHLYGDSHDRLPAGCAYPPDPSPGNHFPGISWHTSILPYLEQEALSLRAQQAYSIDPQGKSDPVHDQNRRTLISGFLCPAESSRMGGYPSLDLVWANTSYLGVMGSSRGDRDGIFCPDLSVRFADIIDGTSNTVMIGERPPGPSGVFGGWYSLEGHTICLCPKCCRPTMLSTSIPAPTADSLRSRNPSGRVFPTAATCPTSGASTPAARISPSPTARSASSLTTPAMSSSAYPRGPG